MREISRKNEKLAIYLPMSFDKQVSLFIPLKGFLIPSAAVFQ